MQQSAYYRRTMYRPTLSDVLCDGCFEDVCVCRDPDHGLYGRSEEEEGGLRRPSAENTLREGTRREIQNTKRIRTTVT